MNEILKKNPPEQQLILMQGASGSGKSTRALEIARTEFGGTVDKGGLCYIYSTDEFFYVPHPENPLRKVYAWDASKIVSYHRRNQERTRNALIEGFSVIVDNTNLKRWQCVPYVEMAAARGIPVRFEVCLGEYDNIHGVEADKVKEMREGREELTLSSILATRT